MATILSAESSCAANADINCMPFRRLLVRGFAALGLGAATTVAIAWSCALFVVPTGGTMKQRLLTYAGHGRWMSVAVDEGWGSQLIELCHFYSGVQRNPDDPREFSVWMNIGHGSTTLTSPPPRPVPPPPRPRMTMHEFNVNWIKMGFVSENRDSPFIDMADARGWPMLSMCCAPYSWRINPIHEEALWLIRLDELTNQSPQPFTMPEKYLPLRPIPLGFAVDTGVFALVWLGLLTGAACIRQRILRKRGLCTRRYDLNHADHAHCPECGTLVPGLA